MGDPIARHLGDLHGIGAGEVAIRHRLDAMSVTGPVVEVAAGGGTVVHARGIGGRPGIRSPTM